MATNDLVSLRSFASTRLADRQLLYRGRVVVGQDGNGVTADSFATTVVGDQVRYVLIVAEEVCRDRGGSPPPAPCPPPVDSITISLNAEVVLETPFEFERNRVEIALNATAEGVNEIVISARGQPNAVTRVAVVSERPTDVLFSGLSVLPWASTTDHVRTFVAVHNAGAAQIGFRIAFFNTDGSLAGRSAPQRLGRHATESVNLNELAAALDLRWTSGAVHVEWVGRGSSRVSTVASEEHRELNGEHAILSAIRTLPLDDYLPRPVTVAAAEEFGF